jgi:hypothetical protein
LPRKHPSLKVLPVEFPHTRLKVAIITVKNRSAEPRSFSSMACVP